MLSASPMTMMAALTFSTNAVSTSTMPLPQNGSPPFASARRHKNSLSLSLSLSSLSFCHARVFLKALSLAYLGDFFSLSLETLKKRKEKCRGIHHHTRRERETVILLFYSSTKRFKKKFFALSPLHKRARVVGTLHRTSLHSFSPIIWWDALERLLFENAFSFSRAKCFFKEGKICVLKNTRKIHRRNVH